MNIEVPEFCSTHTIYIGFYSQFPVATAVVNVQKSDCQQRPAPVYSDSTFYMIGSASPIRLPKL